MRFSNHRFFWGMCLLTALWSGFVAFFYGPVLLSPNTYLFAPEADGLKTLYTLGYQIRWGQTPFEFKGMHYPYGDFVNFSVGHPGLSILLGHSAFAGKNYAAIIHILLLAGLIFTPVLMARNYMLMGVPVGLTLLAASGLFLLNPQMLRLEAHIDLAHMWVIPLGLLLMFKSWNSSLRWPAVVFVAVALFVFFIHPYLGLMLSGLWSTFFLLNTLLSNARRRHYLFHFLLGLLPVILFLATNTLIDNRENRSLPGGFWEMTADWPSVFQPTFPPLAEVEQGPANAPLPHWETWSYVGLSAQIIVLIAFVWLLAVVVIGKAKSLGRDFFQENAFALLAVLAAMPMLWFAMGMPWLFNAQTGLPDGLEFISQFRAPGRFTWVFWHCFTLLSASVAGFFVRKSKVANGLYAQAVPVFFALLLVFNGIEGFEQNLKVSRHMGKPVSLNPLSDSFSDDDERKAIADIRSRDFEAAVTMPYFHIGSENFGKDSDPLLKTMAFRVALQTGLPLCCSQMSRTSYTETLQQVALWYEALEKPRALEYFDPNKKILVLANLRLCNPAERQIVDLADSISACGDIVLYSLPVARMAERYDLIQKELSSRATSASSASMVETFEESGFKTCGTRDNWEIVKDIKTDSMSRQSLGVCSFWVRDISRPRIIRQTFKIGLLGDNGWQLIFEGPICHNIVGVRENDALVEYTFRTPFSPDSLRLEVFNSELPQRSIEIDNLLFREGTQDVVFESNGIFYLNNRPCPRPE